MSSNSPCAFSPLAGSSNSSKYFASNDSSDTSRKARKSAEAKEKEHAAFPKRPLLQEDDPLWTMIKQTPDPVLMTYQISPRYQTSPRPDPPLSPSLKPGLPLRNPKGNVTFWASLSTGERECCPAFAEVVLIKLNVSLHCPPCYPEVGDFRRRYTMRPVRMIVCEARASPCSRGVLRCLRVL